MMNSELMQRFQAAAETIRQRVGEAEIGVILGSGLGDYVDALQDAKYIDYKDIPGFPVSTAPGHAGRWWTGTLHGQRVCMMQGASTIMRVMTCRMSPCLCACWRFLA